MDSVLTEKQRAELIEAARRVRTNGYAPYSNFQVGAALLCKDGRMFVGVNVENAAINTVCAERHALGSAVTAGSREFLAVAVCTAQVPTSPEPGAPCGPCRQALAEFGLDLEVILVHPEGEPRVHNLRDLFPHSFGPNSL